ncbi:hypothetical protein M0804_003611 [Polistes exclamans]|nr:hypothetical protein M0804_003611 [Polistes exclamans]
MRIDINRIAIGSSFGIPRNSPGGDSRRPSTSVGFVAASSSSSDCDAVVVVVVVKATTTTTITITTTTTTNQQ